MLKFDFTIIFQFEKTRTQNCNNRKSFKNNFSCFNVNTFLQASIQKCFTYRVLSKNISLRKNIKLSNSAQTKLREEGFYCYNFVRHCISVGSFILFHNGTKVSSYSFSGRSERCFQKAKTFQMFPGKFSLPVEFLKTASDWKGIQYISNRLGEEISIILDK